jgi:hypothetical protein
MSANILSPGRQALSEADGSGVSGDMAILSGADRAPTAGRKIARDAGVGKRRVPRVSRLRRHSAGRSARPYVRVPLPFHMQRVSLTVQRWRHARCRVLPMAMSDV